MPPSLSEMVEYAKAKQPRNALADVAEQFLTGASHGYDAGVKAKQQKFENELKLIDAKDKMLSIEQKQLANKYLTGILKAEGILPLDDREEEIARTVAGQTLGSGAIKTTNTAAGKANDAFANYDKEFTFGKDGLSASFKTKDTKKYLRTPAQSDTHNKNIAELAAKMASRDYLDTLSRTPGPDGQPIYIPGVHNPNNFATPPELLDQWSGYAERYLSGDLAGAEAISKKIRMSHAPLSVTPKKKSLGGIAVEAVKNLF